MKALNTVFEITLYAAAIANVAELANENKSFREKILKIVDKLSKKYEW